MLNTKAPFFQKSTNKAIQMLRLPLLILLVLVPAMTNYADDAWPGFRGRGNSLSLARNLPITWEQRGRMGWTTRLTGYGQSSPVVWNQQVFVTSVSGDEKENLHVTAVDLDTGHPLWRKDFAATQRVKDSDTVSRGAPTPVVDAVRLYVTFESGDVMALSHAGETMWKRSFVKDYGEIKGPHGYASSAIIVDDSLVIQVCHSGASYLMSLDLATGTNRWKVDHPSETGWSSPVSYQLDQTTAIVVSTAGSVRAYDAKNGHELWYATGVQGNSTSSPTIAGNCIVIGASERGRGPRRGTGGVRSTGKEQEATEEIESDREATRNRPEIATPDSNSIPGSMVIRLGGQGDVTQTHVVWRSPKVTVGYSSPLVCGQLVYFTNNVGVVQCVDLQSGEVKWRHRLPGQMWASAVANDGNLYFFCKEGAVVVMKAGPAPQPIAENQISVTDIVYGIAAVDNAWLVRSGRSLVKIATTPAPAVPQK